MRQCWVEHLQEEGLDKGVSLHAANLISSHPMFNRTPTFTTLYIRGFVSNTRPGVPGRDIAGYLCTDTFPKILPKGRRA